MIFSFMSLDQQLCSHLCLFIFCKFSRDKLRKCRKDTMAFFFKFVLLDFFSMCLSM